MNNKYYYYVAIKQYDGYNKTFEYVTKIDKRNDFAYWNKKDKPLQFKKFEALEMVYGLRANGFDACMITSFCEL